MSDIADLAEAREAELRADALANVQRTLCDAAKKPSAQACGECGNDIPPERQHAVPGVQLCVQCQHVLEKLKARKRQ